MFRTVTMSRVQFLLLVLCTLFLSSYSQSSWGVGNNDYSRNQNQNTRYGNQYGNQGGYGAQGSIEPFRQVFEWYKLDYTWQDEMIKAQYLNNRRFVPENNAISGIKVWNNRVFVTIPRWKDGVPVTLASVPALPQQNHASPRLEPFPNWQMQEIGNCSAFQFVQAIEIDTEGRIWIVDAGRVNIFDGARQSICSPKVVILDLNSVNFNQFGYGNQGNQYNPNYPNQNQYPNQYNPNNPNQYNPNNPNQYNPNNPNQYNPNNPNQYNPNNPNQYNPNNPNQYNPNNPNQYNRNQYGQYNSSYPNTYGSQYNPNQPGYNSNNPSQPGYNPNNPNQPGYNPNNPNQSGYNPNNPNQPGYNLNQQGYNANNPNQPGYNPNNLNQPGYNANNPNQPGYNPNQPGYNSNNLNQPGYNPNNPNQPGYNPNNPNQPGYNPNNPNYNQNYNQNINNPNNPSVFPTPFPNANSFNYNFLSNARVIKVFNFPSNVASQTGSYLNDIVLDESNGWYAYISDQGEDPGIIVYSLREDRSWKVKDAKSMRADPDVNYIGINNIDVDLRHKNLAGLALSPQLNFERTLYYSPLASYNLYSIPTSLLKNPNLPSDISTSVRDLGRKQSISDGMILDNRGTLYYGLLGLNAVSMWDTRRDTFETGQRVMSMDRNLLQWPDSFAIDDTGNLWVVTNRLQNLLTGRVNSAEPNFRIFKAFVGSKSYMYPFDNTAPQINNPNYNTYNTVDGRGNSYYYNRYSAGNCNKFNAFSILVILACYLFR